MMGIINAVAALPSMIQNGILRIWDWAGTPVVLALEYGHIVAPVSAGIVLGAAVVARSRRHAI